MVNYTKLKQSRNLYILLGRVRGDSDVEALDLANPMERTSGKQTQRHVSLISVIVLEEMTPFSCRSSGTMTSAALHRADTKSTRRSLQEEAADLHYLICLFALNPQRVREVITSRAGAIQCGTGSSHWWCSDGLWWRDLAVQKGKAPQQIKDRHAFNWLQKELLSSPLRIWPRLSRMLSARRERNKGVHPGKSQDTESLDRRDIGLKGDRVLPV